MVDDDPSVRRIVTDVLELDGWEVVAAGDAEAAMAEFARCSPHLIVLDVMMPGADGLEVLGQLRGDDGNSSCGIIMLTARGDGETEDTAMRLGADRFLQKPFDPLELVDEAWDATEPFHP